MAQTAENIHEQYPLDGAALRLATDGTPTLIGQNAPTARHESFSTRARLSRMHVGECQRFRTFR